MLTQGIDSSMGCLLSDEDSPAQQCAAVLAGLLHGRAIFEAQNLKVARQRAPTTQYSIEHASSERSEKSVQRGLSTTRCAGFIVEGRLVTKIVELDPAAARAAGVAQRKCDN